MKKFKYNLKKLDFLEFNLKTPLIIFLSWDLWSWKTTISKHIINNLLWIKKSVTSPTYVYYNKYKSEFPYQSLGEKINTKQINVYHFDLYRLKNYDEFFAIWWEDILDNNNWIIIIEWPEIIKSYYKADIEISLEKTMIQDEREITIKYNY